MSRKAGLLAALRSNARRQAKMYRESDALTAARYVLIRDAELEGATRGEIADALGITRQAVAAFLQRRGNNG
jgi:predicted transcriptional regulator